MNTSGASYTPLRDQTCGRKCLGMVQQNLLVVLTLFGVALGFCLGFWVEAASPTQHELMWLGMPGELYIRMLKLMIVPLVVCSVITVLALICVSAVNAARRVDARARAKSAMMRRRESQMHRRELPELDIVKLFDLTEGETLNNVREMEDAAGSRVEKLQEQYHGIDIHDAVVTVKKNKEGHLTGHATGSLIQDIGEDLPDTTPKLSDKETLQIVAEAEGETHLDLAAVTIKREIYLDENDKARLVNVISYLKDGVKRPYYVVDANDGTIVKHWDGLTTYPCCDATKYGIGGNKKMGKIIYGDMPYCLTPTIVGDICYLENQYVRIVDMNYTMDDRIVETASFVCSEGYDDEVNGAYSPALDAFFYGTVVGKMFEEWFNSTALNDKIVIRVHYGYHYPNAFWNSENCTFGDGWYDIYPFTSLDVVGHEIGHGVTEQGSGLEYYDEQGGVNEAFSDILGETSEDYLLKSDMVTGHDIMKYQTYMREFERPENDNISISKVDDMTPYTDPHYSSGVYRRVWYVVVKDYGMEIRDAATVFLFANRMYWHASASFYDVSCGLLMAAIDLGIDTYPFRMAFEDIGLTECDVKTHVFSLNNNETKVDVRVGPTVNPVFKFEAPGWADNLIVTAEIPVDKERVTAPILITVLVNGWEVTNDTCDESKGNIVAQGISPLILNDVADQDFFIKLSLPDGILVSNSSGIDGMSLMVDLTVGYTCLDEWYGSESYMDHWYYRQICGGSFYY